MTNDGGGSGHKGRVLGGRYRLIERIGSGGMGTVWRALDELVEREVAVKQPRLPGDPEDAGHQRAAHRLHREARAAARVDHPAAVSIHDVVVEDGVPWIVMELIRGESLHEVLLRGPLTPAESARIGLAVLGALRAAHSVGIVHRDVKPANVLLGAHQRVVLTDFGIAHIQGEESLTVSGEFVGSLEFIAPERMSGRGAGPASDLWSLGVLLYAAVEGWSPFRRTTLESTLAAILSADPPEPKQAGPLGPLIVRLLAKDPEERPGADEAAAVLEAVTEGWPVPAPSDAGPQDASELREFAEDSGTLRLGGAAAFEETGEGEAGEREAGAAAEGAPEPSPEPTSGAASASESESGAGSESKSGSGSGRGLESESGSGSGRGPEPKSESASTSGPESESSSESGSKSESASTSGSAPDSSSGSGSESATAAGATSQPASAPASAPTSPPASPPASAPASVPAPPRPDRRGRFLRPIPVAVLSLLLVGGTWFATSSFLVDRGDELKEMNPEYTAPLTSTTSTPTADTWTPHQEKGLDAVLSVPRRYELSHRQGSPTDQPRLVIYEADRISVRLTRWDKVSDSLEGQARMQAGYWTTADDKARTQYTDTSFQGHDAVLADTTYEDGGVPTRVMELFVMTDDARVYALRVRMPKGTAREKEGTALFKGARDRLQIGT